MKCPHCGIEVRDTTTVCGYCGGKIPQRRGAPPPPAGKVPDTVTRTASKSPAAKKPGAPEDEGDGEEEGLGAYLQQGEQVLIGSLNISVKKFFFHAYLTDRRIFLIDTQEKKLKVTAKDIPLETITGSMVEFSENSDPVLVLSIRSTDDEIKTMKMVFAGNGMDRSEEIDEWVELLNEQTQPKKQKKPAPKKQPEPMAEEEATVEYGSLRPAQGREPGTGREEIRPAKRPVKDHERQPPVKRLLPLYQPAPQEEELKEEQDTGPRLKPSRAPPAPEKTGKPPVHQTSYREIPPVREPAGRTVTKGEVQSAMKGAIQPVVKTAEKPAQRPVPIRKPEPARPEPSAALQAEDVVMAKEDIPAEDAEGPIFCQKCGKKLPAAANFCPGCGTKITAHKEKQPHKISEKQARRHEGTGAESPADQPRTGRPPVKKGPKGSEMTILHKFLRR